MKKFISFLILITAFSLNAQNITNYPYEEGFEGVTFPPEGWINSDANWSQSSDANSGSFAAYTYFDHIGPAELISPSFELGDESYVTFWWKDDDELLDKPNNRIIDHDTTYFQITTDSGLTWTTLSFLSAEEPMEFYIKDSVDLSAYNGMTVGFRFYDVTNESFNAYGSFVDDFYVYGETDPAPISTFPYAQGFEDVFPPEGWTNPEGLWSKANSGYLSSHSAKASYSHAGPANLVSPMFEVPSDHRVSFWWKDNDVFLGEIINHDTTYFEISEDMGATWTTLSFLSAPVSMLSYENEIIDLSAYANKTVQFRFRDITNSSFSAYGVGVDEFLIEETPNTLVGWCNLQWPPSQTITVGENFDVYAQLWIPGVTDTSNGPGDGIEAWFGLNSENTDPSTWTTWVEAEFNVQAGNNDEYKINWGDELPAGTYYYVSRFRLNGGDYYYGGYNAGGGGFWDGANNVSGELTVNPIYVTTFPYVIDFEDLLMPPVGWSNPGNIWTLGSEAYEGAKCAKVTYNHSGTALLISPVVSLPENYAISFWWKDDDIASSPENPEIFEDKEEIILKKYELEGIEIIGHDTTFFEVSSDMGATWITKAVLSVPALMSTYIQEFVDLSEYGNMDIMFRFRDINDGSFSSYGAGVDLIEVFENIAAAPNCAINPVPADSAINTAITNLSLSWSDGGGFPTGYKVYFGETNPPTLMVADTTGTSIVLSETLDYTTTYYWQVVPYNETGDAVDCPVWQFTTMDDPTIIPPYTQTFAGGFPPAEWKRFSGQLTQNSVLTSTTSGWTQDDFGNIIDTIFGKSARLNIYSTNRFYWLVTPTVRLESDMNYQLKFDLALTNFGIITPTFLGVDDKFAVVISTDNGVTWSSDNVLIMFDTNSNIPGSPGIQVIVSLAGYSGDVKIALYGESTVSNADVDLFVDNFTIEEQTTVSSSIDIMEGWNMLSVPLMTSDMTTASLFPNAVSSIFEFNDGYNVVDMVQNGKGYWGKFPAVETIEVEGDVVTSNISLNEGWNLFGPYDMNILVEDLETNPSDILITNIFGFNDGYSISDELMPGKGYWVKTSEAGEILLNSGPVAKSGRKNVNQINEEWNSVTISDSRGKSSILYLAENASGNYELPPLPPAGAFDVRFGNNTFVSTNSDSRINIQGAVYPIKITANGEDLRVKSSTGLNVILKNGEQISVDEQSANNLTLSTVEIPADFALQQNYPNPFNPSTTIKFSLPEDSKVSLKIYNLLGETIMTLLDEVKQAGYHEYVFDASILSSGVYFYSIEAGSFNQVKKMMLLK